MVGRVCIEKKWLCIEYEGLHIICIDCACYGHYARSCITQQQVQGEVDERLDGVAKVVQTTEETVASMVPETQMIANLNPDMGRSNTIPPNPHGG